MMLVQDGRELADVKTRAQAWVIDITLFTLLRGLIELLNIPNIALGGSGVLISEGILTVVLMFAYLCILPILTNGRTPGKTALGIRIVTLDNQQLTMSRLFIRNWLGYIASGLPLGAGYLWAAQNETCQTWHDLAANTIVVKG